MTSELRLRLRYCETEIETEVEGKAEIAKETDLETGTETMRLNKYSTVGGGECTLY